MSGQKKDAMTRYREATQELVGTSHDPKTISERLDYASQHLHLVSPATSCGAVPEGCEITMTAVHVDVDKETYNVGGKRALSKSALERIAAGTGISWDPNHSRRLDDGSDPYYCHYRAVGHYRAFDGQVMTLMGEKEMDLRKGSAQIEAIRKKAKQGDPEKQISGQREHILSHAESKARLRAIRQVGLQSSYDKKDLIKPFVMARVVFTGRTNDPELKLLFAQSTAASFLGAHGALFGKAAAAELPAHVVDQSNYVDGAASAGQAHAPPPVDETRTEPDDLGTEEPEDADFEDLPPPPGDDDEPGDAEPQGPPQQYVDPSRFQIPGGESKGTPLPAAADDDLEYWKGRIEGSLRKDPNGRYAAKDRELLQALTTEIASRAGDAPDGERNW